MNPAPNDVPRVPLADPARRLQTLATRFQIPRAEEAAGRSLSASLELAQAARRQLGVDVQLVKWRVRGDRQFIDHWAVELDARHVIDLTRVHVDRSARLVCRIDDYPANFHHRRHYPAAPIAEAYERQVVRTSERMSTRFLWACGTMLTRMDLQAAWHLRDARLAGSAVHEFARLVACISMKELARRLERGAARLVRVLHDRPDASARNVPAGLEEHAAPSGGTDGRQVVVDLAGYRRRALADRHRPGPRPIDH